MLDDNDDGKRRSAYTPSPGDRADLIAAGWKAPLQPPAVKSIGIDGRDQGALSESADPGRAREAGPMSTHTPTPWVWEGNTLSPAKRDPSVSAVYSILDADGGYGFLGSDLKTTGRELEADRAFIVLAVNAHDDLVAALAALVDRDLTYLDGFVVGEQFRVQDITRARAALARCRTANTGPSTASATEVEVDEADALAGIEWWNNLSDDERRQKLNYLESLEWSPSPANAWVIEQRDRVRSRKE